MKCLYVVLCCTVLTDADDEISPMSSQPKIIIAPVGELVVIDNQSEQLIESTVDSCQMASLLHSEAGVSSFVPTSIDSLESSSRSGLATSSYKKGSMRQQEIPEGPPEPIIVEFDSETDDFSTSPTLICAAVNNEFSEKSVPNANMTIPCENSTDSVSSYTRATTKNLASATPVVSSISTAASTGVDDMVLATHSVGEVQSASGVNVSNDDEEINSFVPMNVDSVASSCFSGSASSYQKGSMRQQEIPEGLPEPIIVEFDSKTDDCSTSPTLISAAVENDFSERSVPNSNMTIPLENSNDSVSSYSRATTDSIPAAVSTGVDDMALSTHSVGEVQSASDGSVSNDDEEIRNEDVKSEDEYSTVQMTQDSDPTSGASFVYADASKQLQFVVPEGNASEVLFYE